MLQLRAVFEANSEHQIRGASWESALSGTVRVEGLKVEGFDLSAPKGVLKHLGHVDCVKNLPGALAHVSDSERVQTLFRARNPVHRGGRQNEVMRDMKRGNHFARRAGIDPTFKPAIYPRPASGPPTHNGHADFPEGHALVDDHIELWIGEVDGTALVYDHSMQLPDCPHLFLWSTESGMQRYVAAVTRRAIKAHSVPEAIAESTKKYMEWKAAQGPSWLAKEAKRYESQRRAQAKKLADEARDKAEAEELAIEEHAKRLAKLGLNNSGVRRAKEGSERVRATHCYSCKKALDGAVEVVCVSCSWMLCECGACGCGFVRSHSAL